MTEIQGLIFLKKIYFGCIVDIYIIRPPPCTNEEMTPKEHTQNKLGLRKHLLLSPGIFSRVSFKKKTYQPRHNEFLISFVAESLYSLANVPNLPYCSITVLLERPTFARQDPNDTEGEISLTHFCALLQTHRSENPNEFKVKTSSIFNAIYKHNDKVKESGEYSKIVNLRIPTKEMDATWHAHQQHSAIIGKKRGAKRDEGARIFREFLSKHPIDTSLPEQTTVQNKEWFSKMETKRLLLGKKITETVRIPNPDTKKRFTYFMVSMQWPSQMPQNRKAIETFQSERELMYEIMFDTSLQQKVNWEFFHIEWMLNHSSDVGYVNLQKVTFFVELETATAMCTFQKKFQAHGKQMKMIHPSWNVLYEEGKEKDITTTCAAANLIIWKGLTKKEDQLRKESLQKRNSCVVANADTTTEYQKVSIWETKTQDMNSSSLFYYTMIRHKYMGFISERSLYYNLTDQLVAKKRAGSCNNNASLLIIKYKVQYDLFDIKNGYLEESVLQKFLRFPETLLERHNFIESITVHELSTTTTQEDAPSSVAHSSSQHFQYTPSICQCFAMFIRLKTSKMCTYKSSQDRGEKTRSKKRRIKLFDSGFSIIISRLASIFFNKDILPLLCRQRDWKTTGILTENDGIHYCSLSQTE